MVVLLTHTSMACLYQPHIRSGAHPQAPIQDQGMFSSKYHYIADAVEPVGVQAQPSAPRLPSATEVPQLSVWCSHAHDHFDDGMSCDSQNLMSITAVGMHKPGRQASPNSSIGSMGGSELVKLDKC